MAIDSFNRDVGAVDASSMLTSLSGQVKKIVETRDTNAEAALAEVTKAVHKLTERMDRHAANDAKSAAFYAQQLLKFHQGTDKKEKVTGQKEFKSLHATNKASQIALEKVVKMASSPNTFWVGVGHFNNKAISQFKKIMVDCGICRGGSRAAAAAAIQAERRMSRTAALRSERSAMSSVGNGGGGGNMGGGGGFSKFGPVLSGLQTTTMALAAVASQLSNMFEVNLKDAFNGVLVNSNRFRENLRAIIFQTQTFGDTNREVEKQYNSLTQSILASGVGRAKYEALWVNNLQRGFAHLSKIERMEKNRSRLLQIQVRNHQRTQTTALNTATTLGMNAESINDVFMDWHMHLSMSANEIADMGRSMRQISLNTGVTGANLEKAVKAADSVIRQMRSAGTLSSEASKNVLEMTALAQKFGIEEAFSPMMKALAGANAWEGADPAIKGFLVRASGGDLAGLMSGRTLGDKDAMKQIQGGAQAQVGMLLRNFGVDVGSNFDFTKLSDVMSGMSDIDARSLQLAIKGLTGMEVGDLERSFQVLEESTLTVQDRLANLNKEIADSIRMKGAETDATKALLRQKDELESSALMTMFGKLIDGKDISKELGAGNISGSASRLLGLATKRASAGGFNIESMLGARGTTSSAVERALRSGSAEERSRAMAALTESMEELTRREKEAQDPITEIAGFVKDINTKLGDIANRLLFSSDLLIKVTFWTGKIGGMMASILGLAMSFRTVAGIFGTGAGGGGLMGGGGAGTAGAGATISGGLVAQIAGGVVAPIMLLVGAVKGWRESETAGRTKLEGALFGMTTGGAGTGGGLLGSLLGTKKGSAGDKAAGVATAGLWGTGLGAAIGTMIAPGPGTAIGAAIGGVLGMGFQLLKILTEGTTLISDLLSPVKIIFNFFTGTIKDIWGIFAGIVTLDFERAITSWFSLIGRQVMLIPNLLLVAFKNVFFTLPQIMLKAISAVFLDLPRMILESIRTSLMGLRNNEWVGPIFAVLGDAFEELYKGFMSIYTPLKQAFDEIYGMFNELSIAIFGTSIDGTMFKMAIQAVAHAIANTIKPIVVLAQVIRYLMETVGGFVQRFKSLIPGSSMVRSGAAVVRGALGLKGPTQSEQLQGAYANRAQTGNGDVSTNLLDYSDDTRGTASPLMTDGGTIENRVAQERYGSMPTGGHIPGMESIEGYLATEQNLMKVMVDLLTSIKTNTDSRTRSQVIGPRSRGLPPNSSMAMRRISLEQNAGQWDVTFGDFSPSSVTTEGRRT